MDGSTWDGLWLAAASALLGLLMPAIGLVLRGGADYLVGRLMLALDVRRLAAGLERRNGGAPSAPSADALPGLSAPSAVPAMTAPASASPAPPPDHLT